MVHVRVPADDAELAADLLWRCGAGAVEEKVGEEDRTAVVIGDADAGRVRAGAATGWAVEVVEVHDHDWRDQWRAWATPTRVGRVLVQPTWLPSTEPGPGVVVVHLDPGQSFGDGRHPSTRLALASLLDVLAPGASVLDAGAGSGVLAIAAKLLGADRVVAVDHAPAAAEATAANAATNGVEVAWLDDLSDVDGVFDVVLANIGAAALVALAPLLERCVAVDGALVLSGVLSAQVAEVVAAYPGLTLAATAELEGWASPTLRRRS